jgi:hypothetical protein
MQTAANWFSSSGLIVGEAYRSDAGALRGRAPLLRHDGESRSRHMVLLAGPAATRPPRRSARWPWSGDPGRVASTRRWKSFVSTSRSGNMGYRVLTLNPESRNSDGFNALDGPRLRMALLEPAPSSAPSAIRSPKGAGSSSCRDYNSQSRHQSSSDQQVARRLMGRSCSGCTKMHDEQIVLIPNAVVPRYGRSISGARRSIERVRLSKVQSPRSRTS